MKPLYTPARAGRIFEFVHSPAVVNERSLPGIVGVLLGAIRDQLHIAEKVCYALAQLAAGFKDDAQNASLLSPYFKDIVAALLEAVRAALPPSLCTIGAAACLASLLANGNAIAVVGIADSVVNLRAFMLHAAAWLA